MYVKAEDLVAVGHYAEIAAAQQHIDGKFAQILANRQGNKYDRPWDIVQIDKGLNADDAWVGYEFETGFDKQEDYEKVCNFLWFNQDYTSIDREGTGNLPMEIVYSPQNYRDIAEGKGRLRETVEFFDRNGLVPAKNPTTFTMRDVGIHANISTPSIRKNGVNYAVLKKVNAALSSLTDDQHDELYGRHVMHWGYGHSRRRWIEFKLFRSLPTLDRIATVERVTGQIIKLLNYYENNPNAGNISNAYEFLSGGTDEVKL